MTMAGFEPQVGVHEGCIFKSWDEVVETAREPVVGSFGFDRKSIRRMPASRWLVESAIPPV
jgi:hypothetical protein